MFGISLPELIVILAIALIVVGPDKLPGLARSLAKGLTEMKKTLNQVKESLAQEEETIHSIKHDLRSTADELRTKLINTDLTEWKPASGPATKDGEATVIDVEPEARAIEAELRDPYESAADIPAADRQEKQPPPSETAAASNKPAGDSAQAS